MSFKERQDQRARRRLWGEYIEMLQQGRDAREMQDYIPTVTVFVNVETGGMNVLTLEELPRPKLAELFQHLAEVFDPANTDYPPKGDNQWGDLEKADPQ